MVYKYDSLKGVLLCVAVIILNFKTTDLASFFCVNVGSVFNLHHIFVVNVGSMFKLIWNNLKGFLNTKYFNQVHLSTPNYV